MALVTYILLSALAAGLHSRFHPEVLGLSASKAIGVVFADFAIVKLACYLLNVAGQGQVLDVLAYGGYKFVGVIVTVLAGLMGFRSMVYWLVFLYMFLANAFFLVSVTLELIIRLYHMLMTFIAPITTLATTTRRVKSVPECSHSVTCPA